MQNIKDTRPDEYLYWNQLKDHLSNDTTKIFNKELIYPKQWEVHLPANHIKSCQLNCKYCAGQKFIKDLYPWELDVITVLDKLEGKIPFVILGGAYTEPLMNPYLLTVMAITRKHGSHFGIHTNGINLKYLEDNIGFLTEANRIAGDDSLSYISVSLDGGSSWNWKKAKRSIKSMWYWEILEALKLMVDIRDKAGKGHAIRLGYLIQEETGTEEELITLIHTAKNIGVDSVRFSIPFAFYKQSFDDVKAYKKDIEESKKMKYIKILEPFMSKSKNERPYLFWSDPWFTDIDRFDFNHCAYSYFQITTGADGYYYPCSTVATPTAKHLRLGKMSNSLIYLQNMILKSQNPKFNPKKLCFEHGLRCNRMGLEINCAYDNLIKKS